MGSQYLENTFQVLLVIILLVDVNNIIDLTDESFALSHGDCSGIVGMANHGRNTNNSQFYITLKPSPWMDKQYVALG